ncbi:MAG TPA: MBL fold metallo-hydrolase [Isosphaeraceae bacterium]|jgi:glyoxylase-like metal-dependent hydrolase (beta-lactamase superfamily II)|nr:MBL fold metallo-hydrolase [Isosphaeraceae bacterium]
MMKRLAEDVYQLPGLPPNAINVYQIGGVLVDSGTRFRAARLLRQLRGRALKAHALTHAHPDHQGSTHAICSALGLELWCGAADADAVEDPRLILERLPRHWLNRSIGGIMTGPAHPVSRRLREGDQVEGFTVLETPGHSRGHISYWRSSDRVLIVGDVLAYYPFIGLHEPPRIFSPDPAQNRQSARRLAALEPALMCFGHGPPLRDTEKFVRFVNGLPE